MLSVHEETIQERILGARPTLRAVTPKALFLALKSALLKANGSDLFRTPQDGIHKWVQLDPKDDRNEPAPPSSGLHVILGGVKDFRREAKNAHLIRDDGAWIHFTITVEWDGKSSLELIAYDFEIVFPEGHSPKFVRIDLNKPGHENESRELRSHIHVGNDDLLLPAPLMTPEEILHLLVHGLRPRNVDKPRT